VAETVCGGPPLLPILPHTQQESLPRVRTGLRPEDEEVAHMARQLDHDTSAKVGRQRLARWLLWVYPPIVLLACAPSVRKSLPKPSVPEAIASQWGLAVVCLVGLVGVSVAYFPYDPLPSLHHSVVYFPDLVFHLGVAAEAELELGVAGLCLDAAARAVVSPRCAGAGCMQDAPGALASPILHAPCA